MNKNKEKIPWFGGLTPSKLLIEMGDLMVKEKEEGWDKETYNEQWELLLNKYNFRPRNDADTLYEATKIWEQYYTEDDLPDV